ncbi:hypothetical protein A0J61_08610 [Choanephora cucurbitarum]|uniref:MULE transposase domain-containing protein n=1 Tax=Choanephora cucurbitarum TaxID=101091 RepID=A0A1C7N2K6_9FUNG|nr:hypothetical protein A0J61_08610 [Choanephora cucurbitarum]
MSQVSIIDVIYLTDNVKIPVASIYGVYDIGLDKLMTFSVACAFVSDEKEGTFECFLQQLKNLLIQRTDLASAFQRIDKLESATNYIKSGKLLEGEFAATEHTCWCHARLSHMLPRMLLVPGLEGKLFSFDNIYPRWHLSDLNSVVTS